MMSIHDKNMNSEEIHSDKGIRGKINLDEKQQKYSNGTKDLSFLVVQSATFLCDDMKMFPSYAQNHKYGQMKSDVTNRQFSLSKRYRLNRKFVVGNQQQMQYLLHILTHLQIQRSPFALIMYFGEFFMYFFQLHLFMYIWRRMFYNRRQPGFFLFDSTAESQKV